MRRLTMSKTRTSRATTVAATAVLCVLLAIGLATAQGAASLVDRYPPFTLATSPVSPAAPPSS